MSAPVWPSRSWLTTDARLGAGSGSLRSSSARERVEADRRTPEQRRLRLAAGETEGPVSLLIVAGALGALGAGANLATPLYAGYGRSYGLSSAILALIFATYALVLIPALLVFGQLSDRLGRRRVIATGLGVGIVGLALFSTNAGVWSLFVARAVQGLSVGMVTGAAAAALLEFDPLHDRRRAAVRATLALSGGIAAGPILAGVVAQWLPMPFTLPYLAGIVCCALPALGLLALPRERPSRHGGWRLQRPAVPSAIRREFVPAGLSGAAVWSVAALFLSVIPSYAAHIGRVSNVAVLGAISTLLLAVSCLTQMAARRHALPARAQAGAMALLAVGLLLLALASPLSMVALVIIGAALAGSGHGLGFLAAQDQLNRIAPADQRAEVNAALYTCVYLGVSLPVIGTGIIAALTSTVTGVCVFAAVTGASSLALAVRLERGHGCRSRPRRGERA